MSKFNTKVGRDFQNALLLAKACDLAYFPEAEGRPKFQQELGMDAHLISVDNTQAYVGHDDGAIVVAFRGSESPNSIDGFKDWLLTNAKNFLILPEGRAGTDFVAAGVGARFHKGFIEALEEIWAPLLAEIQKVVKAKARPVFVTGHSLGGALALLAAWRLHRSFIPIHQIYTFGAPMIGNDKAAAAFQKSFPGKIFRFVDRRDLVPRLPTVSLQTNEYLHCQEEVPLGPQTVTDAIRDLATSTPQAAFTTAIIDQLWGKVNTGVSSHLMPNYLAQITEGLSRKG